jgi:hypothetical protein
MAKKKKPRQAILSRRVLFIEIREDEFGSYIPICDSETHPGYVGRIKEEKCIRTCCPNYEIYRLSER